MDLNYLEKKYKSIQHEKTDIRVIETILSFIKDKKYVLYGGTAIDILIKHASNGSDFLYDHNLSKKNDFDIIVDDPYEDSIELTALIYKKYNNKYAKIITGLTGKTRKIFIDLDSDAICDLSSMNKKHIGKTVEIDGIQIIDPQYLKIDQYKNLTINVYEDYHRIQKNILKIEKLEKWYPLTESDDLKSDIIYNYDNEINSTVDIWSIQDLIFGGDFVYNYLSGQSAGTSSRTLESSEMILYTNDIITDREILEKGYLHYPKYRIMPLEGAMLYVDAVYKDKKIKICTKMTLVYEYYKLLHYTKDIRHVAKIQKLLKDDTLINDNYKILNPENKPYKDQIKSMKTLWIREGKVITPEGS